MQYVAHVTIVEQGEYYKTEVQRKKFANKQAI